MIGISLLMMTNNLIVGMGIKVKKKVGLNNAKVDETYLDINKPIKTSLNFP